MLVPSAAVLVLVIEVSARRGDHDCAHERDASISLSRSDV